MNEPLQVSQPEKRRLVIHFTHLRPYHLARIRSAEDAFAGSNTTIQGIALFNVTGALSADLPISRPHQSPLVLFPDPAISTPTAKQRARAIIRQLDQLRPTAVAICGYATPDARACLRWCRRNAAKAILMTETREQDGQRVWWKEWIKARVVRSFDAALCGGSEARAYLEKLGMPSDRIAEGYDVVDNEYFASESMRYRNEENHRWTQMDADDGENKASSSKIQNSEFKIPPYFLASGRFIPRKNYGFLIEAYAQSLKSCQLPDVSCQFEETGNCPLPWNLCLLGDGELKGDLIAQCHRLGLNVTESAPWESSPTSDFRLSSSDSSFQVSGFSVSAFSSATVFFPGWRPHAELPRFYAHAGAFVHPALSEPWGLVVNEALACGLPILIGKNTGAARTLQQAGTHTIILQSNSPDEMARRLKKMAACSPRPKLPSSTSLFSSSAFGKGLANLLIHSLWV